MAKIQAFEENSILYESWFDNNPFVYKAEVEAVRQLIPDGNGIEIGIGSGRYALPLRILVGIEPSEKMAKIAEKHGITIIPGIAENLPIEENSYDFALMVTTICFIDFPQIAINEAFRIIKPNGKLICAFIDKESPIGKLYIKNQSENVFYKDALFYSTSEIEKFMRNSGFVEFEHRQTIFNSIEKISENELIKNGTGEGSFVVISGKKG
jgi:ubiquinone/menaquinone biosynthesis C-methylase UbiE